MAMFGLWFVTGLNLNFNSWTGDRLWATQWIYRFRIGCRCLGIQSRLEERAMLDQFGDEYERYRENVKAFVPFVW